MNRKEIINRQRALNLANKRYPEFLIEIDFKEYKYTLPLTCPDMTKYPVQAWRSSQFFVQAFDERPGVIRLSINRTMIGNDGHWLGGITWDQLQEIKNQCGFGDLDGVEVFPPNKDLQFCTNMRHLFVFRDPLDFVWRAQ